MFLKIRIPVRQGGDGPVQGGQVLRSVLGGENAHHPPVIGVFRLHPMLPQVRGGLLTGQPGGKGAETQPALVMRAPGHG